MSIRVLQVISSGGVYGKEQVVSSLCSGLSCDVVDISSNSDFLKEILYHQGIRCYQGLAGLKEAINSGYYYVVHSHDFRSNFFTVLFGLWKRIIGKVYFVRTKHGYTNVKTFSKKSLYKILDRLLININDWVIGVTFDPICDQIIRNGAIKKEVTEPLNKKIVSFMDDKDRFIIAAIGRLSPEKNHENLIKAFLRLEKTKEDKCKLIIFGNGPEIDKLNRIVDRDYYGSSVYIPGFVKNPTEYLKYADIFVQPSLNEGTPITLLEVGCMDNPPIVAVTPVGEMKEFIENRLVYPILKTEDGIKTCLDVILSKINKKRQPVSSTQNYGRRMGDRLVSYVKENHALSSMVKAYHDCYTVFKNYVEKK